MPDRPSRSQDSPVLWTIAFSGSIALHAAVWLFDPRVMQVAAPEGDDTDAIAIELIDDPDKPTARSLPQQNRPRSQTNATPTPRDRVASPQENRRPSPQPTPQGERRSPLQPTPEPSPTPTPTPTPTPEPSPTPTPTPTPTPEPSPSPEPTPTPQPTPSPEPTPTPTPEPTPAPTPNLVPAPSPEPTPTPTPQPPGDTGSGSDPDPQPPQPQGVQISIVGSPRLGQETDIPDNKAVPLRGNTPVPIADSNLATDCANRNQITVNVQIGQSGRIEGVCDWPADVCHERIIDEIGDWPFEPATQEGGVVSSCLEMDLAIDPL